MIFLNGHLQMVILFTMEFVLWIVFALNGMSYTVFPGATLWMSSQKPFKNVLMIPQLGKPVQRASVHEEKEWEESGRLLFSHCW